MRGDFHAFLHTRDTCRQQLVTAFYFHQAQAAGAHVGETVQVAEGGYVDPILTCDFENGLIGARTNVAPIDL